MILNARTNSVRIVLGLLAGDVTSTSTVHKHYKAWREELVATQRDLLDRVGFSQEFTRAFMTEISRHATESESRYKSIADDALDQSAAAIDDLRAIEDRLSKQVTLLAVTQKDLSDLKAASSATIKALEERLIAQEQACKEQLSDSKEIVMQLNETVERQNVQLATASIYEAQNKELNIEAKDLREQLSTSLSQCSSLTEKVSSRDTTINDRNELIAELRQSSSDLHVEFKQAIKELQKEIDELTELKGAVGALTSDKAHLEDKIAELNKDVINLNSQNFHLTKEISTKDAIIKDLEVGQDPKKE